MAAELEPYTVRLPDRGVKPSFLRLAARVTTLTAAALALKEGLWLLKRRMEHDADDSDTLAEQCAAAEVEPRFTGLVHEAGTALRVVATASGDVASAADLMEYQARGFGEAHQSEYRGIYEAVNASGVRQAKPGFYRTR